MGIGQEEFPLAGETRGEIRYYKLGGELIQRTNGLDIVRSELENMGIPLWDGGLERGRSDSPSGQLAEGEIIILDGELDGYPSDRLGGLGGTVRQIDPGQSFLHSRYMRHQH